MKYFISYTTRDKEITKELLLKFAKQLNLIGEVYTDLINNNSQNKQERVMNELDDSNVLILIDTFSIHKSQWVQIELARAKAKKLPVLKISIDEVVSISKGDKEVKQILHAITDSVAEAS